MQNPPLNRAKLIILQIASAIVIALGVARANGVELSGRYGLAQAANTAAGEGLIKGVNAEERKLQIAHGPILALQWPAMTMAFSIAPEIDISGIKPGTKVKFTLDRDAKGLWLIKEIHKVE